jgi:hypothetical protein
MRRTMSASFVRCDNSAMLRQSEQIGMAVMDAATMIRTSLIFFVGGLLLATAAISAFMIGDMVWRSCWHSDPTQTCAAALFFATAVPFYAIVLAMGLNFLPLFVGAVLAVVGRAVFGRLPLWFLMTMLPACALAYVAQESSWYPHEAARPLPDRLLIFAAFQVPCLLICWWWDRRGYD